MCYSVEPPHTQLKSIFFKNQANAMKIVNHHFSLFQKFVLLYIDNVIFFTMYPEVNFHANSRMSRDETYRPYLQINDCQLNILVYKYIVHMSNYKRYIHVS